MNGCGQHLSAWWEEAQHSEPIARCGLTIGRVADPNPTAHGVAVVAAPLDLLITERKAMLQRAERKGYEDVAVLLQSDLSLAQALVAARAVYSSG